MMLRHELGEALPVHYRSGASEEQIELGRQLIHEGRAEKNGSKGQYISRFYVCTSCHNTVREDPDLTHVDPAARLNYAVENDLPYLQGSTFWGIVNRTEWYNDDYVQKYGDLVIAANKSLEASTQLCAQVCSQGRPLDDWEIDAIMAYFSSLEVKVADLDLDEDEINQLESEALDSSRKLAILDQHFLTRSPATFVDPPENKSTGYSVNKAEVNLELGARIYELGCQHCHRDNGESDLILDDSKKTARWLRRNFEKDSRYSIYEIIRHGTYAEFGHREYMPHYTAEKMSDVQIESLRAYIEHLAD